MMRIIALLLTAPLFFAGCFPESGGGAGSRNRGYAPERARNSSVRGASAARPLRIGGNGVDRHAAEAFAMVNDERARRGMRTLRRRADLDAVAQDHARDLLRMNRLSHASSDGRQLEHRLARLDWEWAGENLARNKGFESPAAEAVKGWIASPRHFENMFRPDYTHSGMASLYDPESGFVYFVQVFITAI